VQSPTVVALVDMLYVPAGQLVHEPAVPYLPTGHVRHCGTSSVQLVHWAAPGLGV